MTPASLACRLCGAAGAAPAAIPLRFTEDIELEIRAPLCAACTAAAPDRIREIMAKPMTRAAMSLIAAGLGLKA